MMVFNAVVSRHPATKWEMRSLDGSVNYRFIGAHITHIELHKALLIIARNQEAMSEGWGSS